MIGVLSRIKGTNRPACSNKIAKPIFLSSTTLNFICFRDDDYDDCDA